MTLFDVANLRAQACNAIAALGGVLDALQAIEQVYAHPGDEFATSAITAQQLDEAAGTAETLCEHAHALAFALDWHQRRARERADALERGAPFDETLPGEGGAS